MTPTNEPRRGGTGMKTRVAAVVAVLAVAAAGCDGKSAGHTDVTRSPSIDCSTASQADWVKHCASASPVDTSGQPSAVKITVRLVWWHLGEMYDDPQVWYVARVTNGSGRQASAALDVKAVDGDGTIVGSAQPALPNLAAGASFDYFGVLGGGLGGDELSGTPAGVKVTQAKDPFGQAGNVVDAPMLKTGGIKLKPGDADAVRTDYGVHHGYDLHATVTNTTGKPVEGGVYSVTQQVVLYDAAGKVVGGDTGTSDQTPKSFGPGESYREQWTEIPAVRRAASVKYTVWLGAS